MIGLSRGTMMNAVYDGEEGNFLRTPPDAAALQGLSCGSSTSGR